MTTNRNTPDFNRDQWGRPLIVPEGGGKPVAYTRSSTAAKTVEDTYNLERWARRNVAYGFATAPGLVARLLPLGAPDTWTDEDKATVNELVERANEVAQSSKGADTGTAVHRLTELLDLGLPVAPGPYAPDLEAYTEALELAGLEVVEVECRLVCDELRMAGTADRIVRDRAGRYRIADLKTGSSVDYGALGWAAQLAAYAHSSLYDPETGVRLPTPALDTTTGIVVHLPAGRGVCELYELDLVAGYRAAELANEIRGVRNASRRWITRLELPSTVVAPAPVAEPVPAPTRQALHLELGTGHDEGAGVTPARVAKLRARHDELDPALQLWAAGVEADARRHGVGFRLKDAPTERRLRLYGALVLLASSGSTDDELVRAVAYRATGLEASFSTELTLGHVVGAMDADSSALFLRAAADLEAGELVADFSTGSLRLLEAARV